MAGGRKMDIVQLDCGYTKGIALHWELLGGRQALFGITLRATLIFMRYARLMTLLTTASNGGTDTDELELEHEL